MTDILYIGFGRLRCICTLVRSGESPDMLAMTNSKLVVNFKLNFDISNIFTFCHSRFILVVMPVGQ